MTSCIVLRGTVFYMFWGKRKKGMKSCRKGEGSKGEEKTLGKSTSDMLLKKKGYFGPKNGKLREGRNSGGDRHPSINQKKNPKGGRAGQKRSLGSMSVKVGGEKEDLEEETVLAIFFALQGSVRKKPGGTGLKLPEPFLPQGRW